MKVFNTIVNRNWPAAPKWVFDGLFQDAAKHIVIGLILIGCLTYLIVGVTRPDAAPRPSKQTMNCYQVISRAHSERLRVVIDDKVAGSRVVRIGRLKYVCVKGRIED